MREIDLLELLVPKINAQTDANGQPTFGTLDIGTTPNNFASVTLTASNTAPKVGETFTVDIDINTGDFQIADYRIFINFNKNLLSVLDAETNVSGTQVLFKDPIFSTGNGGANEVSDGQVKLIAGTASGNALQVNRTVATITFQVQAKGNTAVSLAEGISGTQLINQNDIAIATTLNSVNLNLGTSGGTASKATTTTSQTATSKTSQANVSRPAVEIPQTGIVEDVGGILPAVLGFLLIAVGINLASGRKRHEQGRTR